MAQKDRVTREKSADRGLQNGVIIHAKLHRSKFQSVIPENIHTTFPSPLQKKLSAVGELGLIYLSSILSTVFDSC